MVAKVSVSSHVVVEIIKSGKMYDESVDLQTVIKSTSRRWARRSRKRDAI